MTMLPVGRIFVSLIRPEGNIATDSSWGSPFLRGIHDIDRHNKRGERERERDLATERVSYWTSKQWATRLEDNLIGKGSRRLFFLASYSFVMLSASRAAAAVSELVCLHCPKLLAAHMTRPQLVPQRLRSVKEPPPRRPVATYLNDDISEICFVEPD